MLTIHLTHPFLHAVAIRRTSLTPFGRKSHLVGVQIEPDLSQDKGRDAMAFRVTASDIAYLQQL